MSWKGGQPCGVLTMMARFRALQESCTSSAVKKAAGSPASVVAGGWTWTGTAGSWMDLRRICAKLGDAAGAPHAPLLEVDGAAGVGTGVDDDNELEALEIIHHFVEILDRYFGSVCELDLIFNFHKDSLVETAKEQASSISNMIAQATK
ncbi:hypothetical protein Taro_051315 [Colocasia esculenta]|uniref:AP complex mu/sigma subunit domain-containing protein n=1 Tax=Colocasia esculenta TaxID=4460 RepID=A0A843XFM7_COLES|nr:hypothetical protein [Colocasia esculenta]